MEAGGQGLLKATCVEGSMEVLGLSQAQTAKRRESHVVGKGVIASLAPHFHGEEALRKKSWVFSKLCLFKTLNPTWALPHPQLPPPAWSQHPRDLGETPVFCTQPLWSPFACDLLASSPQSHLGNRIPAAGSMLFLLQPPTLQLLTRDHPGGWGAPAAS